MNKSVVVLAVSTIVCAMDVTAGPATADAAPQSNQPAAASTPQHVLDFLKKFDDPAGRVELRKAEEPRVRRSLAGFDKHRNLDAATFEKLITLEADQSVERRALMFRCSGPGCDSKREYREMTLRHQQATANLIGPGGYEEAQEWSLQGWERSGVNGFERRLPRSAPLSEAQAVALLAAMNSVRKAAFKEQEGTRKYLHPYASSGGVAVYYQYGAPSPDERMASARSYSQRLRDQAATVLSGEQLALFNQMLDETLSSLERDLRKPGTGESTTSESMKRAVEYVKKYDDPAGRSELRKAEITRTRRGLEGFDKYRGLDVATFEKLIELLADQTLERKSQQYHAFAGIACGDCANPMTRDKEHRQAIEALIGEGGQLDVGKWWVSDFDRKMLNALGKRLPAEQQLTSDQSASMFKALNEARWASIDDDIASPLQYPPYINKDGSQLFYANADTLDERMASARIYVQRVRNNVEKILQGQQLVVFNQMQDELLADLERALRSEEGGKAAGS